MMLRCSAWADERAQFPRMHVVRGSFLKQEDEHMIRREGWQVLVTVGFLCLDVFGFGWLALV